MLAAHCTADTLRVVTWRLGPAPADRVPAGSQIRTADLAAVLNPLAADVILLQQVPDWQACAELAEALKPANYTVLVCSAFRDARTATLSRQQVAILAKHRAYVSWSRPWTARDETTIPGGFAFAAIRVRGQRLGFFSVQPGNGSAPLDQLVDQVVGVRSWVTNQVQLFVVGGTLDAGRMDQLASPPETWRALEEAGFANVFLQTPAMGPLALPPAAGQSAGMGDYLFTQPPGCATSPRILSSGVGGHLPVLCDLQIDPAWIAAAWANQSKAASSAGRILSGGTNGAVKPQAATAQNLPHTSALTAQLIAALVLGAVVAVIAATWVATRRRRALPYSAPRLLPVDAEGGLSSYTVIVGTQSGTAPVSPPTATSRAARPMIHVESSESTHTQAQMLQRRALAAEQRAARATAALRSGLIRQMSRWLKQKLARKLMADRTRLLEGQRAATEKARTVEERLARVELQIQQQSLGYQQRIEDLTRELTASKAENRELIRAQIRQVKAEMEAARSRLLAQAQEIDRG